MRLALILLAQLLHGEILLPVEAKSPDPNAQPAKSEWPLRECQDVIRKSREMKNMGCVCEDLYQVCQPLQLSAAVNGSVTLPCSFSHDPSWGWSREPQIFWRLGQFHSKDFLFNCCQTHMTFTHPDFQGRVSLVREEGQPYTASIRITALRESDSRLYFCRVSVRTPKDGKKEWQNVNGTNLTVTASLPQRPEGKNNTTPLSLGVLAGVSTGAFLAAAILLGLAIFLLTQRKGHCPKRTQARTANGKQEEKEVEEQELPSRGAMPPSWEKPISPPPPIYPRDQEKPGPVYASLVLSEVPKKKPLKRDYRAEEETTYAAVRH